MLRLAPADEPPAEEPNQTTNNSDHGHRDARDRPAGEAALVDRGVRRVDARLLCDVAGDGAWRSCWRGAAHAVFDTSDSTVTLIAISCTLEAL